jgi:hypothetical protein
MNNHQLEARAAKAKVDRLTKHVEILEEELSSIKGALRKTIENTNRLAADKSELERFVAFANQYYPGSIEQYKAIKRLEGAEE